jgi:hypothetical protein
MLALSYPRPCSYRLLLEVITVQFKEAIRLKDTIFFESDKVCLNNLVSLKFSDDGKPEQKS